MQLKKAKKILYLITQSELGGAQKYVFDLAKNLRDEFEISVAFGEQGNEGELARKLKTENISFYSLPHLKRAISPINDLIAIWEIRKLIKEIQPDIIHLNSSKISILGSIANQFSIFNFQFSIIYTVHGWVFNEPLNPLKKLLYKYAEKITAKWKDKIICVSEYDRQIALKEKIASPEKLITIHNGIESMDFLSREKAQQELGISDKGLGTINIVSVGNLYKTKGYEDLIETMNILVNCQLLNVNCYIIGDGPERINLEKLIKDKKLENKVILSGRIDNAVKYLKAFDLYACASIKEGLSYTLIEAMQAGLPIVATKVGGNPELIQDGITGLLTKAQNPQDLAEKIKQLIKNQSLAKKLGEEAKIIAQTEFTLEKMVAETREIYKTTAQP